MTTEKQTTATQPVTEDKRLRDYELVYIIRPDLEEEALNAVAAKVTQLITSRGGIIASEDKWGKRRLAYPIKHMNEGQYILLKIKMLPENSKELESNLRITEEVLRHLLIKVEL